MEGTIKDCEYRAVLGSALTECRKGNTEAECMNIYNFDEVSGHNLES